MPKVTKQVPTVAPANRVFAPNGLPTTSILARAIPVGDIADDHIRMCIYGQNRAGKTTLACQFKKPLLLVAFEPNPTGGARSVKNIPGVTFLRLHNDVAANGKVIRWASEKGLALCRELEQSRPFPFATVVVDGATSYQDYILQEVMGWDSIPEQLSFGMVGKERYQARAEKVKEGLRPFLNLPCDVIMLAKEKDHNPKKDDYSGLDKMTGGFQLGSFFAEDVGGSVAGWLHDACDFICQLWVDMERTTTQVPAVVLQGKEFAPATTRTTETGRKVRRLRCCYEPNIGRVGFAGGFRSCNPACIPDFLEAREPEEMYRKFLSVVDGTYRPDA